MKIQQRLDKLSQICEKTEIEAITRKLTAYLDAVIKNKNIDNFGNEVEVLKKRIKELSLELDRDFSELAIKAYMRTKNKAYLNWIEELVEIKKGNYSKTQDMLKWEDLISYVEKRFN